MRMLCFSSFYILVYSLFIFMLCFISYIFYKLVKGYFVLSNFLFFWSTSRNFKLYKLVNIVKYKIYFISRNWNWEWGQHLVLWSCLRGLKGCTFYYNDYRLGWFLLAGWLSLKFELCFEKGIFEVTDFIRQARERRQKVLFKNEL